MFPGFLAPVLTQLFFPKPPTTFLTCFCSGERRKYAGKKSRLNWGSNSQPAGHESDTLTTEPPGGAVKTRAVVDELCSPHRSLFRKVKAVGKWLVTGEEGDVNQATCVWSLLPNFICQYYHGLLFKNLTTRFNI